MNNTYYDEKIKTVSEDLQYAILLSDWTKHLIAIRDKYRLHIDQTQVLEDSVMQLMFGDIDAPDFINHMFNDAHINSEMAADILLDVDLQILKNIRERLIQIEEEKKEEEEIEEIMLSDEERALREERDEYAEFYKEAVEAVENIENGTTNIEEDTEIPENIEEERNMLLQEIEKEESHILKTTVQEPILDTTHQLQNTHIETPFKEESIIPLQSNTLPIEQPIKPTKTTIKKPITINLNDIYREPIE